LVSEIEFLFGPSLSNYWGKGAPEGQVANVSYLWGLGFLHRLNSSFGVSSRLLFEGKGFKREYTSTYYDEFNNPTTARIVQGVKSEYITVLVTPRYYIGKQDRFYCGLGAFASKLQKAHNFTETYSLQGNLISNYYADATDYRDFDWGLHADIGYRISLWRKITLALEIGGNVSLSDGLKKELPHEAPNRLFNVWFAVDLILKL